MQHGKRLVFVVLFVALFAPVAARADDVDDYVNVQMRRRHIPGLALAVARDGKIIKERGYGLASVEHGVPVTPDTVFEIGSISKQITAAAVMLLVEEGKISPDERIARYLPNTPDAWRDVTVRHLLTHTSGIKNYTGLSGFELTERLGRDDFIKRIGTHPQNFQPGQAFSYGNTNYNLLGFIIEAVTGRSYWDFVGERIFKPLGMNSTHDRNPRHVIPRRANGYEWEDGVLVGRDYDLTDVFSAGAVVSTVRDLAKWDAALGGERLLKRASLEQIWTPLRFNDGKTHPYGFGWYIEQLRGRRVLRHNGQTAGFAASIGRYTDDRLSVIVLTNLGDLGIAGRIGQGIAKLYVPALSLKVLKPLPEPDALLARTLRDVLHARLAGHVNAEAFAPDVRDAAVSAAAQTYWRSLADYGPVNSFDLIGRESTGQRRSVLRYRAALGRQHLLLLKFTLTEDGKIAEMSVEEEE